MTDAFGPQDAAGFYLSADWLSSLRPSEGRRITREVRDDQGELVGLVPTFTTVGTVDNPAYSIGRILGDDQDWLPQTIVGSPAGYANALLVRDDSALPGWAATAVAAIGETTCSAAVPYLEPNRAAALQAVLIDRPRLLCPRGRCVVRLDAPNYDSHVAAMPASRRAVIRKDLRMFDGGEVSISTAHLSAELAERLAPLLVNVQEKHGSGGDTAGAADYLQRCRSGGLERRSVVFSCTRGPDLVGFALGFVYGSSLVMRVVGLDYKSTGGHAEYFTLLIHAPSKFAITRGLRSVDLGTEGYRTKLLRGAIFVPSSMVLLKSPHEWPPSRVSSHNCRIVDDWISNFGDLYPSLAQNCGGL